MLSKLRELIAAALVGLALFLLGWSYWPVPMVAQEVTLQPEQATTPSGFRLLASAARVTIQWPRWIRYGESAAGRVIVAAVDPAARDANPFTPFNSKTPVLESKLDAVGAQISPSGVTSTPRNAKFPLRLEVSITPLTRDPVEGVLWLTVRQGEVQIPLAVQAISVEVIALGGLTQPRLLWLGWGSLVLGAILSFPNIERWFFNKF